MTTEVNQYRVYCNDEADYVYTWSSSEPTTCPNNNGHTINASLTTIVDTVSATTVKTEENTEGYFETEHILMNIPSGTPGDVTEHDVTWPCDQLLWRTILDPTSDMIGDSISVLASPETTVGVLMAPVNIGDTTVTVNSTVTDNAWRGFLITIDDGVNKDVLGRCTNVDSGAGTISFQTPTSYAFAPGTPVKISVYVLKDIRITNINTIDIGSKGFKGKTITAGLILRVYYTNNSGTAKEFLFRSETYMRG